MRKYWIFLIAFPLLLNNTTIQASNGLEKQRETKVFIYYCTDQDIKALRDVEKILAENYQRVCKDLKYDYPFKVTVEIYPDQATYDQNLMDRSVIGSPASSGQRKIQLVSPLSPIRVSEISYKERLLMAVHEFVHLMLNEINITLPIWLHEGVASFEGSPEGYETICKLVFPKVTAIHLLQLEQSYYDVPGADVYSYTVVRFIKEKFGYSKLNQLIRRPLDFEKILLMTKDDFSKEWNIYIQNRYRRP